MTCESCGGRTRVVDSRPPPIGHRRRRYLCVACGARWTTIELTIELRPIGPSDYPPTREAWAREVRARLEAAVARIVARLSEPGPNLPRGRVR